MGKHSGNRSVRNRIRKRRQRHAIISLLLLAILVIVGTFMWKHSGVNLANNQTKSAVSTVNKSSSSQSTAKKTMGSSHKKTKIKWVKQDQPVKFPILMYHAIHNMDPSEAANAGLIVSPETFESHLKALKDAGYYTLTPEEAYKSKGFLYKRLSIASKISNESNKQCHYWLCRKWARRYANSAANQRNEKKGNVF